MGFALKCSTQKLNIISLFLMLSLFTSCSSSSGGSSGSTSSQEKTTEGTASSVSQGASLSRAIEGSSSSSDLPASSISASSDDLNTVSSASVSSDSVTSSVQSSYSSGPVPSNGSISSPIATTSSTVSSDETTSSSDESASSQSSILISSSSSSAASSKVSIVVEIEDQVVPSETEVVIKATIDVTPQDQLDIEWTQIEGPIVDNFAATGDTLTFTSPQTLETLELIFKVVVTDSLNNTTEEFVTVHVAPSHWQAVAMTGDPAAGFTGGETYTRLGYPVISRTGKIVFGGEADSIPVVWSGTPGDFKPLLKRNDAIPGLGNTILFDNYISLPGVNSRGDVLIPAQLKGAVTTENNIAVLVHTGDDIELVLRTGDPAPLLPDNFAIGRIDRLLISDAGVVINAAIIDTENIFPLQGIWYWDFDEFHLLGTSIPRIDLYADTIASSHATHFGADCYYSSFLQSSSQTEQFFINDRGDIVFTADVYGTGNDCPAHTGALYKWNEDGLKTILTYEQEVPNVPNHFFQVFSGAPIEKFSLGEDGSVSFLGMIFSGEDAIDSYVGGGSWVISPDGSIEYLVLDGEKLPNGDQRFIFLSTFSTYAPIGDVNGNYTFGAPYGLVVSNTGYSTMILNGEAKVPAYGETLENLGEINVDILWQLGDPVPGQAETTIFSYLTGTSVGAWTKNYMGDIVFGASFEDVITEEEGRAYFYMNAAGSVLPVLWQGAPAITSNGVYGISSWEFPEELGGSNVQGIPSSFSDQSEWILRANVNGEKALIYGDF